MFCGLEPAQFKEIRSIIVDSVLATDMTCHFDITNQLKVKYTCLVPNTNTPTNKSTFLLHLYSINLPKHIFLVGMCAEN